MACLKQGRAIVVAALMALGFMSGASARAETPLPAPMEQLRAECAAGAMAACVSLGEMHNSDRYPEFRSFKRAAELFKKACDAKNMRGCNGLGDLYFRGNGVPRNEAIAATLYQRACDANDGEACFSLGYAKSQGRGVPRDPAAGTLLYGKACRLNYLDACLSEADAFFSGEGVERDDVKGLALYIAACDKGSIESCLALASRYRSGNAVPQDTTRSLTIYAGLCSKGVGQACAFAGDIEREGATGTPATARAAAYFSKACDAGDGHGCEEMARLLYTGEGVAEDKPAAMALLQRICTFKDWRCFKYEPAGQIAPLTKACDGGDKDSCTKLGDFLNMGDTVTQDVAQAALFLEKACNLGSASSCAKLASLYANGQGVAPDAARAAALNASACDGGEIGACTTLASAYLEGNGVFVDQARAASLFVKACDGGDRGACAEKDRLTGLLADLDVDVAGGDYKPPPEPASGDVREPSVRCHIEKTHFEGKTFTQRVCSGAVINGYAVSPGSAPWQALIERPARIGTQALSSPQRVLCGGSLVAKGWILTAAHCLYEDGQDLIKGGYRIRLGVHSSSGAEGISYPILKVVPHKEFRNDDPAVANDIALVQYDVGRAAKLGDVNAIRAIRIDQTPVGKRAIKDGMPVYSYGWGWTAAANSQASDTLRGVKMALRSEAQCTKITRFVGPSENSVLCAGGENGAQACFGDSGGPLITYGDPGGGPTLIGIVSAGKKCGSRGDPSRYTRVSKSLDWILPIIRPAQAR